MISVVTSASDDFFKIRTASAQPAAAKQKNLFRRILDVLTYQERRRFYFLAFLDVIISLVDILSIALLLCIIQFYIQPSQSRLSAFLPPWLTDRNSIALITVFFFLFAVKNILAFIITGGQNKFTSGIAVRISEHNLKAFQHGTFEQFVNSDSSVHLRKIALQPFEFCQYLLIGVQQIITQTSLIIISIIAILFFNAGLFFLITLILMPPVIAIFFFIKRRLSNDKLQIKTSNQMSFQYLMDALKGYVEANIYDRNEFFLQRFIDYRKKYSAHLFDSITIQTLPGRLVEIFAVMGLFVLIVIASWSGVNDGKAFITIGAFMAAAYKIIPGIVKMVNTASQIKAHEFCLMDIAAVQNVKHKDEENDQTKIHSIQFSNVSFQYHGSPVINNLSFTAECGDFIGIEGVSGKGKTTILNMLLGFLSPCGGNVKFNDDTQFGDSIKKFWPSISYVRQQSYFIHDTILRNIILEDTCDEQRLQYVLNAAGLNDLVRSFPEGIEKIIAENGKNISGGQQQRISLARAIYKTADVILLDEPFNELDEASEKILLQFLKQLADDGKIIVMVTHNKHALSFCNKVVTLDG